MSCVQMKCNNVQQAKLNYQLTSFSFQTLIAKCVTMEANLAERSRGRGGGGGRGGGRPRTRRVISDEIRATMVDHVERLTLREAGQRVQPNLSHFTVASIIRTFQNENSYVLQTLDLSSTFTI